MRSIFTGAKNVMDKKPTKGEARLGFFVARAVLAAKHNTILLCVGFLLLYKTSLVSKIEQASN
jgi:hypothetical protein